MSKYIPETDDLDREAMTGQELMEATSTVVRAVGRSGGIEVSFRGDGAYTDGKEVVLPAVGDDAKVTKRQALVIGGYANHETLHTLLTDFGGLRNKMVEWHNEGKHLTKAMANAIEDVRIENGGKTLYQGIPQAVDKTAREVNRQFIDKVYPRNKKIVNDFGQIGPVAVTWAGRKALGYADESNEEALSLLPNQMRKRVEKIARQALGLDHGVRGMGDVNKRVAYKGSRDAAELAERIVEEYMKELEEEQKQQQQQQAKGNGDGEGGEGQSGDQGEGQQGSGDAEGQGEGKSQGDGEDTKGSGKDGNYSNEHGGDVSDGAPTADANHGAGASDVSETAILQPVPFDPNLEGAIAHVVTQLNHTKNETYRVLNPSGDLVVDMLRDKQMGVGAYKDSYRRRYQQIKQDSSSVLSTIRRKLERALMAQADTYWENGKRQGRLDVSRNAARIVQLKPNVYRTRQTESRNNTAMQILVDCSGSMMGREIYLASQASIAICEALEPMHVPLEVLGHHTFGGKGYREAKRSRSKKRSVQKYGRHENIMIKVFKSFDDTLQQARPSMGAMADAAGGANADGDAIMMAAKRLLARPEPRKVMFVMSDGRPAYTSDTVCEHQRTRDCVQWVQDQGIEIVGLGICDESVRHYYHKCIVINDINEFAVTYINEVVNLLMGKSNGSDNLMRANKVRRNA